MESVLHGGSDNHLLPIVIYLDDIAIHGDTEEKVLENTIEAIKQLVLASFMLNLHKIQLLILQCKFLDIFGLWAASGYPKSPSSPP